MNDNRHYADYLHTKKAAQKRLLYWIANNDFKGRVISEQDGREMVEGF